MKDKLREINKYIQDLIKPWHAVGMSVGIVHKGKLVLENNYGYKDYETKELVTENTLYPIGSASKAFTSTAIGILIDDGLINSFDDLVKDYIPEFKASNQYAEDNMTIKDLLSMRGGYSHKGYDNMLFHGSHYSSDEIIEKSKHIPFDLKFRDVMRYDNLNYILLGKVIENVSKLSWHEFISRRIFKPLLMNSSGSDYKFISNNEKVASAHLLHNNKIHKIKFRNIDNAAAAGAIVSNVKNMANWVLLQLNQGIFKTKEVISKNVLKEIHSPHMIVDKRYFKSKVLSDSCILAYAYGWFVYEHNGYCCIGHGGHIDGFSSYVQFVPELDLGIVILANSDHNDVGQPILRTIVDAFAGVEKSFNYNQFFLYNYLSDIDLREKHQLDFISKVKNINVEELYEYQGKFCSKIFGCQKLYVEEGKLKVERFDWVGELKHLEKDVFVAFWDDDLTHPPLKFKFYKDEGEIVAVDVDMFGKFNKENFRRKS